MQVNSPRGEHGNAMVGLAMISFLKNYVYLDSYADTVFIEISHFNSNSILPSQIANLTVNNDQTRKRKY